MRWLTPPRIEDTVEFIINAHGGQTDLGGLPYFFHPIAVMQLLPHDAPEEVLHAALLHDVLEDTEVTAQDLKTEGYTDYTVWLVEKLSRPKGPNRPTYMRWIKDLVGTGDRWLMEIKLADNMHNLDPKRQAALPEHLKDIKKRYERSAVLLREGLSNLVIDLQHKF